MNPPLAPIVPSDEAMFMGLIVQPFLAGVLAFALFPIILLDGSGRSIAGGYPTDVNDAAMSVAIAVAFISGVVSLLGVLPAALWITKRRQLAFSQTLLYGLGFGALTYFVLALLAGGRSYGADGLLRGVSFASVLGLAGAAAFWLIALRPKQEVKE